MNRYKLNKSVSTTNSFERLEEELDDASTKVKKTAKPPSIFVIRVDIFSLFSLRTIKVATDEYEIKIINSNPAKELYRIRKHYERAEGKQKHGISHIQIEAREKI